MHDERSENHESLFEGAESPPPGALHWPTPPDGFKDALWDRTASRVRSRVARRRAFTALCVCAAYVAGASTMLLFTAGSETPKVHVAEAPQEPDETIPNWETVNLNALLQHAIAAPAAEQAPLLKLAGDRLLSEWGDIENAVAYYRQYLDQMDTEQQSSYDPYDNWLLTALKQSRITEVTHENTSI